LAASEPNVASPVALSFDENGRLFICEMRDYSEQDKEHLGRIRMLEDTDGDGVYDKATIYADDLSWPTGVFCCNGGVFVTGAQHGMSFDDWGRKFVSSNSDHIQIVMIDERYLEKNPFLSVPAARESIAADGPQAEVFRISPVEPWRIVRTRLRVSGAVPGMI